VRYQARLHNTHTLATSNTQIDTDLLMHFRTTAKHYVACRCGVGTVVVRVSGAHICTSLIAQFDDRLHFVAPT
jgi:hypothetical protein